MIMVAVGSHDGLGSALDLSASVNSMVQGPPKAGSPPPRRWRCWGKACRRMGFGDIRTDGRQTAGHRR